MSADPKLHTRLHALEANGEVRHYRHAIRTNDTKAQVETDGWLDALAESFVEGVGDIIDVKFDMDGTPGLKTYLVARTADDIALTAAIVA